MLAGLHCWDGRLRVWLRLLNFAVVAAFLVLPPTFCESGNKSSATKDRIIPRNAQTEVTRKANNQRAMIAMKKENIKLAGATGKRRNGAKGQVRGVLPLLICFLLGLGAGAYWYYRAAKPSGAPGNDPAAVGQSSGALSETLKANLQQLEAPVEIRFYVPAHPKILPEPLPAFVDRVAELLSEYNHEVGGKIRVTQLDPISNPGAEASAKADGIKPLPLATGDFYYLGLALAYHGQKEVISPLALEWEPALPSDLSRALLRLTTARTAAKPLADSGPANLAAAKEVLQEVVRAIPDIASVSLADGTQILRSATLEEIKAVIGEIQTQVAAAQQKLAAAQAGTSEAEQQAARKQLEQLQAQQIEKIQQITQRLHDQIAALKQLKESKP